MKDLYITNRVWEKMTFSEKVLEITAKIPKRKLKLQKNRIINFNESFLTKIRLKTLRKKE